MGSRIRAAIRSSAVHLSVAPKAKRAGSALRMCPGAGLPGTAALVVQAVKAMGLEGVVAKRRGSLYEPGERSRDWQKLKLENQQEFVIGGYRPDGDNSVDALLVGYYEGSKLRFAGKVRAGWYHTRAVSSLPSWRRFACRSVRSAICRAVNLAGVAA